MDQKDTSCPINCPQNDKIPMAGGVLTIRSSKIIAIECSAVAGLIAQPSPTNQAVEERIGVAINLERNLDVFAWKPVDMTGVPRHIAEHRLNVREVMVKKHDGSWRMCFDFKDLNKACLKDGYLLSEIDWKMPFGLRNARATYQRLVDKAFHKQIGRNLEVYVDDLVIKSRTEDEIIRDIKETFKMLREINMKLKSLKFPKDVRKLNGKLASLNSFLAKSAEKSLPFEVTSNEVKFKALIAGLRIAEQMGVKNIQPNVDSRLVVNQVNGTYIAKEADMIQYLEKVKTLVNSFRMFLVKQVPRSENKKADALSKIASTSFAHLSKQVLVEELKEKDINEVEVLAVVEEKGDTWMTPIYEFITEGTLPAEVDKARAVKRKSQWFAMINGILYNKSFLGPWLRCVGPLQANYVIREIHEGSCSMHAGTRSVVAKALQIRYYWPTMHEDARALIWACKDYQAHRTMIKSSNGDTPFSLTYGTEAVIPAEIGMATWRTAEVDLVGNNEALKINLDLLEEKREQAAICEAKSKRKMDKYYNLKVRNTSFKPRDLLYRNNDASHAKEIGKLGPK
ncbi:reverse transcriptase domain-containing protein [Tanacetum coccineum]